MARGGWSSRGRRTRRRSIRVPWEPGRPCYSVSLSFGVGAAKPQSSWPQAGVGPERRDENRRTGRYRHANQKEVWGEGWQGFAHLHSTVETGEPGPRGPWGGKGDARHGLVRGTPVQGIEPRFRVHVTLTNSKA